MTDCGGHQAFIYDRGGVRRLHELTDLVQVRWERMRDDISSASVQLRPNATSCEYLSGLRPMRHELHIFRQGKRVWEGPLHLLEYNPSLIELGARDILQWANRTIIRTGSPAPRPPIPTVRQLGELMRQEMEHHETFSAPLRFLPNLTVIESPDTAMSTRGIEPWNSYVWEELDEAAFRRGIDYTVVGRQVILFDVDDNLGVTRAMTDQDFLNPIRVTVYGAELATHSAVTDHQGGYGVVGADNYYYGRVELLHTAYGLPDHPDEDWTPPTQAELEDQARRNLVGRYPLPARVQVGDNAAMNPDTLTELMEYMVPGIRIPLRASTPCLTMTQMQKLNRIRVLADEQGEQAEVTMVPSTFNDDLIEEG